MSAREKKVLDKTINRLFNLDKIEIDFTNDNIDDKYF